LKPWMDLQPGIMEKEVFMAHPAFHLSRVVWMTQIYWMEKNRWPDNAAELFIFSQRWKNPLDFSGFHTFVFKEAGERTLGMEFTLRMEGSSLASCGRLELERTAQTEMESTFCWHTRYQSLPSKRVESPVYCFIR
jgi:hypothetical protein